MSCTQLDIAKRVGMDVSSINKILNKRIGPVFRRSTIQMVFRVAREMGYDFNNPSRVGRCRNALREIVNGNHLVGVSAQKLRQYRQLAAVRA